MTKQVTPRREGPLVPLDRDEVALYEAQHQRGDPLVRGSFWEEYHRQYSPEGGNDFNDDEYTAVIRRRQRAPRETWPKDEEDR